MTTTFELQRVKIRAVLDKKPLAQAAALAVKTLLCAVECQKDDFWISVDLNVHIKMEKALEKIARINVYETGGTPFESQRVQIKAVLDEKTLAQAMACVVKTLLTAVKTEQEDFWVNFDLNVHIQTGESLEKRARINVYGDLLDSYGTTIVDTADSFTVPSEVFKAFCEDFKGASVRDAKNR